MSKEFFERLREKANNRSKLRWPGKLDDGAVDLGVDATIEALKEMMVGEPDVTTARVREEPLFEWDGKEYVPLMENGKHKTALYGYIEMFDKTLPNYHGTDGEEVVVLAVRLS